MGAAGAMTIDKEQWRGQSVEARQRYMSKDLIIPHPTFLKALLEIERVAERCKNEDRGLAILISGNSGAGKTFLTRELKRRHPEDHSGTVSSIPILVFSVPLIITPRQCGASLLSALYDDRRGKGDADEIFNRAIHLIRNIGTRVICIDDIQDIPERRQAAGIMQIGNWIRKLIDESKCAVVLLGTPAGQRVVEKNSQLRRRTPKRVHISSFDIETPGALARYRRFLLELDKRLPFAELCGLSELDLSKRLYWATYGVLDYNLQLIAEAIPFAINSGKEAISREEFQSAFQQLFQDAAADSNPFSEDLRKLDREGEPFYEWFDTSNPRV